MREALFGWLGDLSGARVLDLFAGSGALGIEALSRGAESVVFVERAAGSLTALRANLESLELRANTQVLRGDAARSVRRLGRAGRRFDLVLADPPYASGAAAGALAAVVEAGVLAPGATLVLERSRRARPASVPGLALVAERRYGDTVITRMAAAAAAGGSEAE